MHIHGVPAFAPYVVVDVEPDGGFKVAVDIPAEPSVQPEPAVQVRGTKRAACEAHQMLATRSSTCVFRSIT